MDCTGFRFVDFACRARLLAALLLVGSGFPAAAWSAQVLTIEVTQQQGRYILHSEILVQAPVPAIRAQLTDYENLPRINRDLKQVEILAPLAGDGVRMSVRANFCILAICLDFAWVQDVLVRPDGDITMAIVPDHGDFRQGSGRWRLLPDGAGTRLNFDLDLTPNFWIPRLFGPWLMKRKLSEEAFETAQGLERMTTPN